MVNTKEWAKDSGIVVAVILLLFGLHFDSHGFTWSAIALLFLSVVAPMVLSPLGSLWLSLATVLNKIVSPIVFSLIYFAVVTPLAFFWRLSRKKVTSRNSYFTDRVHTFTSEDLRHPY